MFETSLGGSNLINRNTPDDTNNDDDFDFELSPKKDEASVLVLHNNLSPESESTSPLHFGNNDDHIINDSIEHNENTEKVSKADFSYLSSQMSPMPGAWTFTDNTNIKLKQHDFGDFIDSGVIESETSSLKNHNDIEGYANAQFENYQNGNEGNISYGELNNIQGVLENNLSKSDSADYFIEDNVNSNYSDLQSIGINSSSTVSPTKSLSFQPNSDGMIPLNNLSLRMNDSDYTNNTSSFLNTSVPTQDLGNMILENNSKNDYNFDDDSLTPIVPQNEFFSNGNKTPMEPNRSIDATDLKLSSQVINEIFDYDNDDKPSQDYTRMKSTTSSVYSDIPNKNFSINNKLTVNDAGRIHSTTSSIYSEIPGHKSIGPNDGLKSFRISSFRPKLHKHLSQPLSILEDKDNNLDDAQKNNQLSLSNSKRGNLKVPSHSNVFPRKTAYINQYQSVSENEPLDFVSSSPTNLDTITSGDAYREKTKELITGKEDKSESKLNKVRVSVLDQSIYQNHYDSKTGILADQNATLSTLKSQNKVHDLLEGSSILRNSRNSTSELSFTSSHAGTQFSTEAKEEQEEDASALFVTAIYAFSSETLESENDSSICLSFDQDEIAFTYNLDDSGWGEVTLLSSLKRGWVPMNYFRSTITGYEGKDLKNMKPKELTETRSPMKLLLKHAGTFLLNPQSKPVYIDGELRGYTFDVECFNGITDGLRKLLVDTNSISRSNSVVQNKPVIRKMRKKLLRGWADLIAKAKDYMGTIATSKIEYLQLLTFHLLQKAITFLDIWGLEQDRIMEELLNNQNMSNSSTLEGENATLALNSLESVNLDIIYLDKPPIAYYRINEVYNQLLTYLCLIAGRIDLVEHNPNSFSTMGVVIGHINLLVNEYFFIIKLLKSTINEKECGKNMATNFTKYGNLNSGFNVKTQLSALDVTTEKLRQLVEELNTYIRILNDSSKKHLFNRKGSVKTHPNMNKPQNNLYFYSYEGGAVVVCSCKMIELSSKAYGVLRNMVNFTDTMVLPSNRKYPNYLRMNVTPDQFIKQCTSALARDATIQKQVNTYKKMSMQPQKIGSKNETPNRASQRYSIFKVGNSTAVQLSSSGLDFLSHLESESNLTSPFMNQNEFGHTSDNDDLSDYDFNPEDEIIRSQKDNKIIGASFRALIYLLTDEINPPSYFFISTFFLTFRIFADSAQLLDALIRRFDVNDVFKNKKSIKPSDSSIESKIRSRRKLVVKAFQFWLESYWNSKVDYVLLAPLMNFFNEGMKNFLPVESYQLLVTASKLIGHPPIENVNDNLNYTNNISNTKQLLPRKISSKLHKKTLSRLSLGIDTNGLLGEIEAYNAFLSDIESYELEKVETNTNPNSLRASLNLSLDLELKNSNSNSVLLTKQQISTIKTVIISYRRMLGTHWYKEYKENHFEPLDTKTLIEAWWNASKESWKILNDDLTVLNFNGLEIAKQLTLIESKMFSSIQVSELLNQNFTTKKLHLNLSPNIQKSILFTNLLSDYVIESILRPNLQIRQRIHAFKCWLKIAISCLYLRNFNSLASIMTSLQSFLITRITKIWDDLSEKYKELFHYLASIIHPSKNYHTYRERLRDFLSTNSQENVDIPTVPYLSLFLQDLTFVVDGNPNYRTNTKSFLDEKLINIDKYSKITEIISDIQTLQISYMDVGELGKLYNNKNTGIVRSETIKNLKNQLNSSNEISFSDMFDIAGVPILQELILLEIWKVKQTNSRDDDRSWKLSCAIHPREVDA